MKLTSELVKDSCGFTLLESLVATLILTLGMSYVWYTFRSSVQLEVKYRDQGLAYSVATSELEALRILPKHLVQDTSYEIKVSEEKYFKVVRQVFDSTDMEEFLYETNIPTTQYLKWHQKPLEVRIQIYTGKESDFDIEEIESGPTTSITTLLPDYIWY